MISVYSHEITCLLNGSYLVALNSHYSFKFQLHIIRSHSFIHFGELQSTQLLFLVQLK